MTQYDQLCTGLRNLGFVELPKRNKYTMFERRRDQEPSRVIFVGANAALRQCVRANAALSVPCLPRFRAEVLAAVGKPTLASLGL